MSWESELETWAKGRTAPPPTDAEINALVGEAERRRSPRQYRRMAAGVLVLAAAAAAALAVLWVPPAASPGAQTWSPRPPPSAAEVASQPLTAGRHAIGSDEVVLDESAVLEVLQSGPDTRLSLTAGGMEAVVSPRATGEHFGVDAGDYSVEVIGTRFRVERSPFVLEVLEGVVDVVRRRDGQTWRAVAGDLFTDGELVRPEGPHEAPRAPAMPSIVELQDAVLAGDLDGARAGITERLSQDDADIESWRLLARLEERAGNRGAGADAWLAVIDRGTGTDAQLARYEAARLLGDQPAAVIPLLQAFLETPHALAGDARLRLADAQESVGDDAGARMTLEDARALHGGTVVGREAARRLQP
jgi:hypothetical protein